MLVRGRPGDTLPSRHDELTAVARLLGYKGGNGFAAEGVSAGAGGAGAGLSAWGDTPAQALEQDYRRTARHARAVMDRLFYG